MSEEQEVQQTSAVEDLVNQITDGELNQAETSFTGLIQDKIHDALEAQRVAVADTIFNDAEEEESDPELDDVDDIEDEDDTEEGSEES